MKKIISIGLITVLSACGNSPHKDKTYHAVAGAGVAAVVRHQGGTWAQGCGAAAAVGLAKEVYDEVDYGGFDPRDAMATALAGCLTATIQF